MLGTDDRLAGVPTGPARGLDLEVVAAPRLDADELPGPGDPDALLGPLVGLHLRHAGLTLLLAPPRPPQRVRASVGAPAWPVPRVPRGAPRPRAAVSAPVRPSLRAPVFVRPAVPAWFRPAVPAWVRPSLRAPAWVPPSLRAP